MRGFETEVVYVFRYLHPNEFKWSCTECKITYSGPRRDFELTEDYDLPFTLGDYSGKAMIISIKIREVDKPDIADANPPAPARVEGAEYDPFV